MKQVQARFYEDYPPHAREKEYNYKTPSTMKPTQVLLDMSYFCVMVFMINCCKHTCLRKNQAAIHALSEYSPCIYLTH